VSLINQIDGPMTTFGDEPFLRIRLMAKSYDEATQM
jgi:hypothetical protein